MLKKLLHAAPGGFRPCIRGPLDCEDECANGTATCFVQQHVVREVALVVLTDHGPDNLSTITDHLAPQTLALKAGDLELLLHDAVRACR